MSEAVLETRAITKTFQTDEHRVPVLKKIDLTIIRGEMVALLGTSGSGKSTLLQILGSLDHPTSGEIIFSGRNMFKISERERSAIRNRSIGFVYQFHHLLPEFTVLENVMMPLWIARMPEHQARAEGLEILEEVGLGERVNHKPGQISGGEQQRVAIARAVVHRPTLLLADEPTGNLDSETAREVQTLLRRLSQNRLLTSLVVTHNATLASAADRKLHLKDGSLSPHNPF